MYEADRPLILLYLVNVLQPVAESRLREEFGVISNQKQPTLFEIRQMLRNLLKNRLVIKRKSLYAVSGTGLQMVSSIGLSLSRDRNRLFFIKKLL